MDKQQLLDRCRTIAGESETWTSDNLSGFLLRFRPDGAGLKQLYEGVEHGAPIAKRLKAVMQADGTTKGLSLSVNKPVAVDQEQSLALVKRYLGKIRKLATELGDEELAELFKPSDYVVKAGTCRINDATHEANSILCDVIDGIIYSSPAAAGIMSEAIYTLVYDFPLTYYIQWPMVAADIATPDPFKPYFELWRAKVKWRFVKGQVVEVYPPQAKSAKPAKRKAAKR